MVVGTEEKSSMGTTVRKKAAALALAFALAVSLVPASMAFAADENSSEGGSWLDAVAEFFAPVANALGFDDEPEAADNGVQPLAAGDTSVVVDQSTLNNWSDYASDSTENIGRIWTDKSVFTDDTTLTGSTEAGIKVEKTDGADFMVSLSALSSASSSVTYSSKPLDIVLVLDTSGSMDDAPHMGTTETYSPVYSRNVQESDAYYQSYGPFGGGWRQDDAGEYYALVGDEYVRIDEERERLFTARIAGLGLPTTTIMSAGS